MLARAEFLDDDLVVLEEDGDFLDEEFVIEDEPEGSDVGFAGPSDAPPPPARPPLLVRTRAARPDRWRTAYVVSLAGLTGSLAVATSATLLVRRGAPDSAPGAPPVIAPANLIAAPTLPSDSTQTPTPTPTSTPTSTPTPTSTETPIPPEATDAKQSAQHSLDHGKPALAIEQGEHSLEIDPEDAETWLIVGAAYLQRGNYAKARRCFSSCVQLATRGPRGECAALVR